MIKNRNLGFVVLLVLLALFSAACVPDITPSQNNNSLENVNSNDTDGNENQNDSEDNANVDSQNENSLEDGNENGNENGNEQNENSDLEEGEELEFSGTIESIGDGVWVIDGIEVQVSENTEVEGSFAPGDVVKIHVIMLEDGTLIATEIEFSDDAPAGTVNTNGNANNENNDNDDDNGNQNKNENENENKNDNDNSSSGSGSGKDNKNNNDNDDD